MPTPPAAAIKAAEAVLTKCAAYDPWFPHPTEAMILAWAEQIAITNLTIDDLLAGVTAAYSERGDGFKPLPADIIGTARRLRQDRAMREPEPTRTERELANAAKLARDVLALAETKTIPDDALKFKRPTVNPLRVPCRHCHAGVAAPCTVGVNRIPMRRDPRYHPARIQDAAAATVGRATATNSPTRDRGHQTAIADRVCDVCGARELVTDHETSRGVCDHCGLIVNGQAQPNGDRDTA